MPHGCTEIDDTALYVILAAAKSGEKRPEVVSIGFKYAHPKNLGNKLKLLCHLGGGLL